MVELRTEEQVLAYLAQMSPTETFEVQPFENGWVRTKILTPEQRNSGQAVGLARLVIDSETAKIYQHPSWSTAMVAQAHMTFKQTGINRAAKNLSASLGDHSAADQGGPGNHRGVVWIAWRYR